MDNIERNTLRRLNTRLKAESIQVRTNRSARNYPTLGDFYAIDVAGNFVTASWVDPQAWLDDLTQGDKAATQRRSA